MKVLLLAPAVPPPIGGLQRMAEEMYRHLLDGHDVRLVATSTRDAGVRGSSIIERSSTRRAGVLLPFRYGATALRQAREADVELVHALTWRSALPVMCIPRARRPPMVVHCVGAELLRTGGLAWLRDRVLREADALVSVSRHTAEVVHGLCGRDSTVIPPGVDLERFRGIGRRRMRSSASDAIRIVSVGRLEPRKGHGELIRAVNDVSNQGLTCRLTIIGGGSETARLSQLIHELTCGDLVEIVQDAEEDRLIEELAGADVFALLCRDSPGDFEGFGIAFVEAAAAGLPIVAGDSPGTMDALEGGRNAVVTRSPREVADALARLAANERTRIEMGAAGKVFAQKFSWPAVTQQLETVYRAVLSARCRPGDPAPRPDPREEA
jgi:phosphatidylinositol alpha-1,6-mannosyltransferase